MLQAIWASPEPPPPPPSGQCPDLSSFFYVCAPLFCVINALLLCTSMQEHIVVSISPLPHYSIPPYLGRLITIRDLPPGPSHLQHLQGDGNAYRQTRQKLPLRQSRQAEVRTRRNNHHGGIYVTTATALPPGFMGWTVMASTSASALSSSSVMSEEEGRGSRREEQEGGVRSEEGEGSRSRRGGGSRKEGVGR